MNYHKNIKRTARILIAKRVVWEDGIIGINLIGLKSHPLRKKSILNFICFLRKIKNM